MSPPLNTLSARKSFPPLQFNQETLHQQAFLFHYLFKNRSLTRMQQAASMHSFPHSRARSQKLMRIVIAKVNSVVGIATGSQGALKLILFLVILFSARSPLNKKPKK